MAYSKLNLALYVGSRWGNGYHPLESAAVSVDIADNVCVEENESGKIDVFFSDGFFVPPQKDSAFRVAKMFFEKNPDCFKGLAISVKKNIRQMAGMGGSSADAAAVLWALQKMYGSKNDNDTVEQIAQKCGSDISFLMRGGAAVLSGKGDDVTAVGKINSDICFVVVYSAQGLSTTEVFNEFDKQKYKKYNEAESRQKCREVLQLFSQGDANGLMEKAFNSLLEPAVALNETMGKTISQAEKLGVRLSMTGSGSALFSAFENERSAQQAAKILREGGMDACVCRPTTAGVLQCR